MCSEGWSKPNSYVDGECKECGMPTVDGGAQYGCEWSPVDCEECGSQSCDESC
jgi:hypothetical protein